jgi:hypothetical protein
MYQITENKLNQLLFQPVLFNHIANFRQLANVEQKRGPKQKYGFGMSYAKKALDYAIRADKVDNFVDLLEVFIEDTKV